MTQLFNYNTRIKNLVLDLTEGPPQILANYKLFVGSKNYPKIKKNLNVFDLQNFLNCFFTQIYFNLSFYPELRF
jgi:hypothetical protein